MSKNYWKSQYLQLLDTFGQYLAEYGNEKEKRIGKRLIENSKKLKEQNGEKCNSKL